MNEPSIIHASSFHLGTDDDIEIKYILEEKEIFGDFGLPMRWPLRVFDLNGMGIDRHAFVQHIAPTFCNLLWDEYDMRRAQIFFLHSVLPEQERRLAKFNHEYYAGKCDTSGIADLMAAFSSEERKEFDRIMPHRRRSLARFRVHKRSQYGWHIARISAENYSQSQGAGDFREETRVFQEMSRDVTLYLGFQMLLVRLGQIVEGIHGHPEYLEINAHQMTTVARRGTSGDGAPEGIHQDGMDYIISALVIERKHIRGGMSYVYGSDRVTPYLHITLLPGQGIFQTDIESPFWHAVTPIYPADPYVYGERSILGFDIRVL